MKLFKRQRGQTIVEFALVFPVFCMLLFGFIYMGMMMVDYVTLNEIAKTAARTSAIGGTPKTSIAANRLFFSDWYKINGQSVVNDSENGKIFNDAIQVNNGTATITAELDTESDILKIIFPDGPVTIQHSMYTN